MARCPDHRVRRDLGASFWRGLMAAAGHGLFALVRLTRRRCTVGGQMAWRSCLVADPSAGAPGDAGGNWLAVAPGWSSVKRVVSATRTSTAGEESRRPPPASNAVA